MVGLDLVVWDLVVGFVFGCGCVLFTRIRCIRLGISGCGLVVVVVWVLRLEVAILGDFGVLCE